MSSKHPKRFTDWFRIAWLGNESFKYMKAFLPSNAFGWLQGFRPDSTLSEEKAFIARGVDALSNEPIPFTYEETQRFVHRILTWILMNGYSTSMPSLLSSSSSMIT